MKLSVSAFRAQASAQRKILSSYQSQLNYGACTSFPTLEGYKVRNQFGGSTNIVHAFNGSAPSALLNITVVKGNEKKLQTKKNMSNFNQRSGSETAEKIQLDERPQMMVDSTGVNPTNGSKPSEHPEHTETSINNHEKVEDSKTEEEKKDEKTEKQTDITSNNGKREESSERSPGRIRTKSNQRWMKLRTTVQLSGAISTNQKPKPPLKREDSFLKRFSTRQIPETQETVDTGDETETLNGSQTQSEVNRRRRKRRKEMSKTVVNPDENFYFFWLMTVTVCVLYNLWTLIVRQSFPELQKGASAFWYSSDGITDAVFICDILVQFRTGYLEQGLMVYNSKKLATHYLKSRAFILDILSLLPLDFLQLNIGVTPILRFPRFFKIYRVYNYYYMVESRTVYPNLWRVVNLIHILLILAHWFGCFYYLLSEAEGFKGDWVYPYRPGDYATLTRKYLGSLYWSTLTLTTIGDLPTPETNAESQGHSKAMTTTERSEGIPRRGHKSRLLQFSSNYGYLFTIISYLIGVFIFATIVGQVGNVITNRNANRLEFERLLDGAKTYMRHHKVPGGMKRRVLRWYDYSWSRGRIQGGGDINTALGLLPDKLKTELALHVNLSVLKKVTIFQECQPEFLHDLVLKMKAYIFTPGDLICRKGEVAREMFIIADGILDVISENGRVLTTMKAGDFFGEIGILNLDGLNKRTADVRSVGYSELFSLSREDVLSAMKDYPEAQEILQSLGRKRLMEAKNASKSHRTPTKLAKDYDSSGESDTPGKRIVEKLRSDVKGIKNALRRSRRGTKTKETLERTRENFDRKIPSKNHSILRRMSHVQSSDEYEINNDFDQSPIGAGLPLLQRLKFLKEKQDKEREEKERSKSVFSDGSQVKKDDTDADTTVSSLPFTQRLKVLRQRETKESAARGSSTVSSTVRTQVTGIRFEKSLKSLSRKKESVSHVETKEKTEETEADEEELKKKELSEIGIFLFSEKLKLVHPNQGKEKIQPMKILQGTETVDDSDFKLGNKSKTSDNDPLIRETENSFSKRLGNKYEVPKGKEAWRLLKKSSISNSRPDKKLGNEESRLIKKVSKRSTYLPKSETVLEKQNTVERHEEKEFRSLLNNSVSQKKSLKITVENLLKDRKKSKSMGHSPKEEGKNEGNNPEIISSLTSKETPQESDFDMAKEQNSSTNIQKMMKMKKYNSISDLSPEYSGLPFVKKLKILNERQKLEELEKELLVRSVSLDVPERPNSNFGNVLVRSQSEATTIEFKNIDDINLQAELEEKRKKEKVRTTIANYEKSIGLKPEPELRQINSDERKRTSQIHLESSIASPESNETMERKHLKSILKKLSAEDSTSDEDYKKWSVLKNSDNNELKKLMRAPTIEGYAARHKKLTKSVTFDSDTLPSSPDPISEQVMEQGLEKAFSPMSPTAILTLQLSNLSMIPIASPKKIDKYEEQIQFKEEKYTRKEALGVETTKIARIREEEHDFNRSDERTENLLTSYALQEIIEKNFRALPFIKSLDDEFFAEIKAEILLVFQQILEEAQDRIKLQLSSLQNQIQNREEVIVQLKSKIQELEVKSSHLVELKSKTSVFEQNANDSKVEADLSDAPLLRKDSFKSIRGIGWTSADSLTSTQGPRAAAGNPSGSRANNFESLPPSNDFFDYPKNFVKYEDEVKDKNENSPFVSHTSQSARNILMETYRMSPDSPSEGEKGLSADFRNEKHKFNRNFSKDETHMDATPNFISRQDISEEKSKDGFKKHTKELHSYFSCSLNEPSDFVALNIDDSSNSSDVEDLHHKDWEVQMLVKELAKKDPNWTTEEKERWTWETGPDVERLRDVRKLREEVNTLKKVVWESDLTSLSASELDILESIVEAKDKKISQLAKANSLDYDEKSKRQKIPTQISFLGSDNRRKSNEQGKKLWLRQKIGQTLSFDFHDFENRKLKVNSIRQRGFYLRKQKTVSGSRKEPKSLYNLWHKSSRLRDRVLEDSDRFIKSMTIGRSPVASSRSSLPILAPSSLPREKTCDMRMSLPLLNAKELRTNFPERLTSSYSSSEEGHQDSDFKESCDSMFSEIEHSHSLELGVKNKRDFNSSLTGEFVKTNHHQSNSSLNSFIKSVGQKMRQVMVGDVNNIKHQVPTISKLCDAQFKVNETELEGSDNFRRGTETSPEGSERTPESQLSKSTNSDYDPKCDPPDL